MKRPLRRRYRIHRRRIQSLEWRLAVAVLIGGAMAAFIFVTILQTTFRLPTDANKWTRQDGGGKPTHGEPTDPS